jgi:hypothetical protein
MFISRAYTDFALPTLFTFLIPLALGDTTVVLSPHAHLLSLFFLFFHEWNIFQLMYIMDFYQSPDTHKHTHTSISRVSSPCPRVFLREILQKQNHVESFPLHVKHFSKAILKSLLEHVRDGRREMESERVNVSGYNN